MKDSVILTAKVFRLKLPVLNEWVSNTSGTQSPVYSFIVFNYILLIIAPSLCNDVCSFHNRHKKSVAHEPNALSGLTVAS